MIAFWFFVWFVILLMVCLAVIYFTACSKADQQKGPYKFRSPEIREAFERWHDHQIEQLGAASNILFAVASAAFGYSLTLLSDNNQSLVKSHTTCFCLFIYGFSLSLIFGLISIFIRLGDFRLTKERHKMRDVRNAESGGNKGQIYDQHNQGVMALYKKTRRMGFASWYLLYAQSFFFLLSGMIMVWFWIAIYSGKP